MKKLFLILTMCLFFNQSVLAETELMAKNYSYEASVHYINRDFDKASEFYKKSLQIRRKLNLVNNYYVTILKLFIYSEFHKGDSCNIVLDGKDYFLLLSDDDKEFSYDYKKIINNCY
jgi:hypothetical protein